MLLVNHGYDAAQPHALITDDKNPLIFFKSGPALMRSIFGDDQHVISNGYQNQHLSRPITEYRYAEVDTFYDEASKTLAIFSKQAEIKTESESSIYRTIFICTLLI